MRFPRFQLKKLFPQSAFRSIPKALIILVTGIVITVTASIYMKKEVEKQANKEFDLLCHDLVTNVDVRLRANALLLRSGAAFFSVSDTVTRLEWKSFYSHLNLDKNLPGIQGLGFAMIIPENKLQQHIEATRKQGFQDYTVHPDGKRAVYTSIIYLEPFSGRNLQAFGYDMFSEPNRRKAMEIARDSNKVTLSEKVILVQETGKNIQAGVLMYLPVYRKDMPANTVEQRRAAIKGWVYSPYRMNDLMRRIIGRWDYEMSSVRLQVYDNNKAASCLLYDSQVNDTLSRQDTQVSFPVDFNGKRWILCFMQSDSLSTMLNGKIMIVFFGGLIISLLLFFLALTFLNTTLQARQIAEKLTANLVESESRFKNMFSRHASIMWLVEPETGRIIDANNAASEFYGYSIQTLSSMTVYDLNAMEKDQVTIELSNALHGKRKYFIFRHRLANGEERTVEVHSTPIDIEGKTFLFAIIHDITDRRTAEDLLEQTHLNYETFFNTIDDFLFVLDEQGNIIHANSTVYKRLGFAPDELHGKSVLMVHPPERREEAGRIVVEMLSGITAFCPVPVITKTGIEIPVETRVSTGFWDGKPAIFGVTKDISDIRLSEEKFSKLFHVNPSACGISDLDDHTYLEVNAAFYSLFGFTKDEVIGKTATGLGILTPETATSIMLTADGQGRVSNSEASLKAKNGTIKQVLLSAENFYVQDKKYRFTVVNDITYLKQAQEELTKLSLRLSLAVRAGGVGVWDYDLVNNILQWDDQMLALYGIDKASFGGAYEAWLAGVHPDDRVQSEQDIILAIKGEQQFDTEFRVVWPDGSIHTIRAIATVTKDDTGRPHRLVGTNWDITHQKQQEEALFERKEQLQKLFATMAEGVIFISPDGQIVQANSAAEWILGLRRDEIEGRSFIAADWEIIRPDGTPMPVGEMAGPRAMKEKQAISNIVMGVIRPDGSVSWINVSAAPVVDKMGEFEGLVGTFIDITERKLADEKLQKVNEQFIRVIESSGDVIAMMDKEYRYILFNSAFHAEFIKIFGKDLQIGDIMTDALAHLPDDLADALNHWNRALAGEDFIVVQEFGSVELERNWYKLHFSPVRDREGNVVSALHIVRNITQRMLAEAEVQIKNEELLKLNREKDKLFSIIAHDLRGPFNAFLGFTQILDEELATFSMAEIQKISGSMRKSANNVFGLLENLLEWSMMVRGLKKFEPVLFPLSNEVADLVRLVHDAADKKAIVIRLEIPLWLTILADGSMFKSLVRNLLFNAVKFTPKGGRITISAKEIPGSLIEISIRDSGIGMSRAMVENLFQMDKQTNRKGTEGEPSTGLGLIICRDIIEKHSGRLWVESEEGTGTVFYFTLPDGAV